MLVQTIQNLARVTAFQFRNMFMFRIPTVFSTNTVGIWNPLLEGRISNGWALAMALVPTIQMAPICSDFKWLGFRISDPIQNPDNLQPNLF